VRKALQVLLAVFGVTAIGITLVHVAFGPAAIPGSVPVNATMDSEDRFYATMFGAFGVALLWCVRDVERKAAVVYFLMATFLAGGIARLISWASVGAPNAFFVAMTALELGLPFLYGWLMRRVARPA
jgi:hypothetical protein